MVHEYAVTQDPSVMVCMYVSFTINLYEWECIVGSDMGNSRSTGHDDCLHRKTWLLGIYAHKSIMNHTLFKPGSYTASMVILSYHD